MMRPEGWLLLAALAIASGCSPTGAPNDGRLQVEAPRIRALIPGQDKTVAYLTLRNAESEPLTLVGAETDVAGSVEIHTTRREGDVLRMRRLTEVEIPAGGIVRFEPGGNHLMLFGVRSLGDHCEIGLIFADGRRLPVTFERVAIGGG